MRVLVTGATGFIGREIVEQLSFTDCEVFQTGRNFRNAAGGEAGLKDTKNFYKIDITDYENFFELEKIKTVDTVIHSAGLAHQFSEIAPEKFTQVNVNGTKNVLRLALKLEAKHFILISSTAVYGLKKSEAKKTVNISELEINEESACQPETAYAESKLSAERKAIDFCRENNIALTILRLAPVIGESNTGNVARLIEAIDGGKFVWIGEGKNYKALIYKADVAKACLRVLLEKNEKTEIFNLAGEPIQMRDFVSIIGKGLGRTIPGFSIPPILLKIPFRLNSKLLNIKKIKSLEKTVEKWLSNDVYSAKKILKVYNFRAETTIEDALKKQIEFYRAGKEK